MKCAEPTEGVLVLFLYSYSSSLESLLERILWKSGIYNDQFKVIFILKGLLGVSYSVFFVVIDTSSVNL